MTNVCLHYRGVTFNKEHPSFLKSIRSDDVASSPGHSQILSRRLRDKIWEWPGDEASDDGHGSYFVEAL